MGPDFILTYYSTDFSSSFESGHAFFFFLICGRKSSYHFRSASKDLLRLTLFWYKADPISYGNYVNWDQAQFSFRFVNNILADKAKRKESLIQTFYKTSTVHFFDWLTFAESGNQNYFHCKLFSM